MSWINSEDFKAIRQQADIVDVISHYLPLEKKGRGYVAVCPFHDDHDPSLTITPSKNIFKCFVCGEGGDVFSFVRKMDGVSLPEAVIKVADIIGYPLQVQQSQVPVKENKNQRLYDVMELYIKFLEYELTSEGGSLALDYLRRRKINDDVLKRFQFGYAPSQEKSVRFLKGKGVSAQEGMDTGLMRDDRASFHERIMIPIHDEYGHPVGFTARTLDTTGHEAKYINTAQTKLYEKGNIVFNYHRVKDFCRKNKRCILVEGAMDVIAFEKADIHESVACLGTACTTQQIQLLKRLQVPITVCYDGDRAGRNATYKFVKMAVANHMEVRVVKNATDKDPDEIFDESGKEGLSAFVSKTISVVDFLFDYGVQEYNLDNYDDKKKFGEEMFAVINSTAQGFEKPTYFQRLQTLTGFDFSQVQAPAPKPVQRQQPVQTAPRTQKMETGRDVAEKMVLSMMLVSYSATQQFKDQIGYFENAQIRDLANYIYDAYRDEKNRKRLDYDVLMASIDEESTQNYLMEIWDDPSRPQEFDQQLLDQALTKIKMCQIEDEIEQLSKTIAAEPDPEKKIELMEKKTQLVRKKFQ